MKIYRSILFIVFAICCLVSCQTADTLTDEEILEFDKQGWVYSIQVLDPYTNLGIGDVNVEVTIGGEQLTLTSNGSGAVEFEAGFTPRIDVTFSKQGYYESNRQLDFSETGGNRSKGLSSVAYLIPSADEFTFTIQGKVTVQSDLTTLARENAQGAKFFVEFSYSGSPLLFPVIVDNTGRYKVKIPALYNSSLGGVFKFVYEGYVADQRIAINGLFDQAAFPATVPSVVQIRTSFDPPSATNPVPVVFPVYATVPAPPAGPNALQATALNLSGILDGAGGVTLGNFFIAGTGGGYAAGDLPLTIVSIDGGSGATGVIRDTNANGGLDQIQITTSGSGYPLSNSNVNKVGAQGFSADFSNNDYQSAGNVNFRPGAIVVNNVFYGTGTSRDKAIK